MYRLVVMLLACSLLLIGCGDIEKDIKAEDEIAMFPIWGNTDSVNVYNNFNIDVYKLNKESKNYVEDYSNLITKYSEEQLDVITSVTNTEY